MEEHTYLIDHDDKKLLIHNKNRRRWNKVLEFSDNLIKVQTIDDNKKTSEKVTATMTVDRLTGGFKEQRVVASNFAQKAFGKDLTLTISGQCEKIEAEKKF